MKYFARTDKSFLGSWWWTVDRVMLSLLLILSVFGVLLVAAASPPVAERNGDPANYFIIRHLIYLVPSVAIMIFMSMGNIKHVWRAALIILGIAVICLMLVPVIGTETKGAQRWLRVGPLSLQPSEIMKPVFVVVAAWLIARQKEKPEFKGIYFAAGLYLFIVLLLLMQPDMGMTFVVTVSFFTIVFLAGLPFRYIFLLGFVAVGAAVLAYGFFPHVQSRVDRFINPESGDTYQIDKSLQAFQHGGLFGTGAGQGTVKLTIPDAHADFIFSVAAEELGMIIAVLLVGL
ncbi:MAG: cell division protein FtsW, partial [Micavibrio aeruginosavorus]